MSYGDLRDQPICDEVVTDYDRARLQAYVRLLDAVAAGADWREAAAVILNLDIAEDPARARRIYDVHLARAQWMSRIGFSQLRTTRSK